MLCCALCVGSGAQEPFDVMTKANAKQLTSGQYSNSTLLTFEAITNNFSSGYGCNNNNNPIVWGWPMRCQLPCVQYGMMDELYFDIDPGQRAVCPCYNGTVYQMKRLYNSTLMSKYFRLSESWLGGASITNALVSKLHRCLVIVKVQTYI